MTKSEILQNIITKKTTQIKQYIDAVKNDSPIVALSCIPDRCNTAEKQTKWVTRRIEKNDRIKKRILNLEKLLYSVENVKADACDIIDYVDSLDVKLYEAGYKSLVFTKILKVM